MSHAKVSALAFSPANTRMVRGAKMVLPSDDPVYNADVAGERCRPADLAVEAAVVRLESGLP